MFCLQNHIQILISPSYMLLMKKKSGFTHFSSFWIYECRMNMWYFYFFNFSFKLKQCLEHLVWRILFCFIFIPANFGLSCLNGAIDMDPFLDLLCHFCNCSVHVNSKFFSLASALCFRNNNNASTWQHNPLSPTGQLTCCFSRQRILK